MWARRKSKIDGRLKLLDLQTNTQFPIKILPESSIISF